VAYAHNAFAEAFAEGGVLALLAFAVVVVLAVGRLWRLADHPQEAIVWGTAVYWVLNAMVSSDLVGNRFMWISLACGLAAYRRSPSQNAMVPVISGDIRRP
jgi:O-antigen ligase